MTAADRLAATDPPPVLWDNAMPATAIDCEAPHLHVYLVVDDHRGGGRGAVGWAGTDRNRAHDYARNTGGVVARLPVVGDYRSRGRPVTAVDWRAHATEANRQRFADAQARLDEGDYPPGEAGRAQEVEDRRFADWYDQAVNGAAHDEFDRQRDEDEFCRHFPESADGSRIEWEGSDGVMQAAARIDYPDEPGNWWVYGQAGSRTWRQLVAEYQIPDGLAGVAMLREVDQ